MKFTKEHTLTSRRNQTITVRLQGSVIKEIDNQTGIRFPFPVGSHWNMGISTWACNNNFTLDGEDPCPEEKIFGIKKSHIPQGHELRYLYPGKFRSGGLFVITNSNIGDSNPEYWDKDRFGDLIYPTKGHTQFRTYYSEAEVIDWANIFRVYGRAIFSRDDVEYSDTWLKEHLTPLSTPLSPKITSYSYAKSFLIKNGIGFYDGVITPPYSPFNYGLDRRFSFGGSAATYYTTWGKGYSWREFLETEVADRRNYPMKEVKAWKKKYNIPDTGKVLMWVATAPQAALVYEAGPESHDDVKLPLAEFEKKWNVSANDLMEITAHQGTIITESDDGDHGFLMLLNEEFEVGGSIIKIKEVDRRGHSYRNDNEMYEQFVMGVARKIMPLIPVRKIREDNGAMVYYYRTYHIQKMLLDDNNSNWLLMQIWDREKSRRENTGLQDSELIARITESEMKNILLFATRAYREMEANKHYAIGGKTATATEFAPGGKLSNNFHIEYIIEKYIKEIVGGYPNIYYEGANEFDPAPNANFFVIENGNKKTLVSWYKRDNVIRYEYRENVSDKFISNYTQNAPIVKDTGFAEKLKRMLTFATGGSTDKINRLKKALLHSVALAKGMEWEEEWEMGSEMYKKPVPKFIPEQAEKQFEIIKNIKRWYEVLLEYEENLEAIIARLSAQGLSHSARLNMIHASTMIMVEIDVYATGYNPNCTKADRAKEKLKIEDGIDALQELITADKNFFNKKMTEAINTKLSEVDVLEEERETLSNALEFLDGEDKKFVEEKLEIITQALEFLGAEKPKTLKATNAPKNVSLEWKSLFKNPEKFIKYDGQFLYPPRIENRLQPSSLDKLDTGEQVGQPKLNGSNTSVAISENTAIAKERHNTFFAVPPKFDFKSMHRGQGWLSFAGEFMNKSKKDHNGEPFRGFCIWEIMAYENQILIGSTIEERINLIDYLYPSREPAVTINGIVLLYYTDTPGIFKVANFYKNFHDVYNKIIEVDMVEGFVMKRKNGKLGHMTTEANNVGWAVKVRKPTANYRFGRGGSAKLDGFRVGTKVGIMRGEHIGKKGYISSIETEYKIKIGDQTITAYDGDFYNDEE